MNYLPMDFTQCLTKTMINTKNYLGTFVYKKFRFNRININSYNDNKKYWYISIIESDSERFGYNV